MSFTFDTWTSGTGDPFISVTAHYIDSPDECPYDWSLKADQLAFAPFEGNHSGANMSNIIITTVERYGIVNKVLTNIFSLCISNKVCLARMGYFG